MNALHTEARSVILRVSGSAVAGAILAYGAVRFFSSVKHHNAQACETTDGLCWTWWDWAAIPLTITITLLVLIVVYKRLDIGPRLAVIPPTILLAPLPLVAAQTTAGWWAATITGGAWSCAIALGTWSRYRVFGTTVSATLLLASLVVLYR
ncbi:MULTISPECIES: hypothetical protein [unclassified Streptomyces]|uniref:hypothetical protein n=1 Tax=unclassified Streptomyces TaxID=2593676 RepID=UPI00382BA3AD